MLPGYIIEELPYAQCWYRWALNTFFRWFLAFSTSCQKAITYIYAAHSLSCFSLLIDFTLWILHYWVPPCFTYAQVAYKDILLRKQERPWCWASRYIYFAFTFGWCKGLRVFEPHIIIFPSITYWFSLRHVNTYATIRYINFIQPTIDKAFSHTFPSRLFHLVDFATINTPTYFSYRHHALCALKVWNYKLLQYFKSASLRKCHYYIIIIIDGWEFISSYFCVLSILLAAWFRWICANIFFHWSAAHE